MDQVLLCWEKGLGGLGLWFSVQGHGQGLVGWDQGLGLGGLGFRVSVLGLGLGLGLRSLRVSVWDQGLGFQGRGKVSPQGFGLGIRVRVWWDGIRVCCVGRRVLVVQGQGLVCRGRVRVWWVVIRVQGLGGLGFMWFRVQGQCVGVVGLGGLVLGFSVLGLGFRWFGVGVQCVWLRVQVVYCVGLRVYVFCGQGLCAGVRVQVFCAQGLVCWAQGLGVFNVL